MELQQHNGVEEFSRERLMEDIRQYPCIYDKFDKDYPDKNAKNNAWASIAAKYGITPMEADKKYKTIRSSYTRYLKKKRSTLPGEKPPPIPVAFVNLDWLACHIDHKEMTVKYSTNGSKDGYYSDYLTGEWPKWHCLLADLHSLRVDSVDTGSRCFFTRGLTLQLTSCLDIHSEQTPQTSFSPECIRPSYRTIRIFLHSQVP